MADVTKQRVKKQEEEIHKLKEELGEERRRKKVLTRLKEAAENEVKQSGANKKKLEQLEQKESSLKQQLKDERKNAFVKYCKSQEKDFEKTIQDTKKENSELEKQLTTKTEEAYELAEEIETLTETLNEEREQHREYVENSEKKIKDLQESIYKTEEALSTTIEQCNQITEDRDKLDKYLREEKIKSEAERKQYTETINNLETLFSSAQEGNELLTQQTDDLQREADNLQQNLSRTSSNYDNYKDENEEHEQEFETILKQLEQQCKTLRNRISSLEVEFTREKKEHAILKNKISIPPEWEEMPANINSKVFPATGSKLKEISDKFLSDVRSPQVKIIEIRRIQNRYLFQQYTLKKAQIELYSESANERWLWHGTSSEAVSGISVNGFDRGYHGHRVGHKYGKGVYFSEFARYSVDYSRDDVNGQRHIILARVLTGDSAPGQEDIKVLPIKDPTTQTRYDSLVSGSGNPGIYVILNDTQAYPEYLITYEVKSLTLTI